MPTLNSNAIVTSSSTGAVYGKNYAYATPTEFSDGLTIKVSAGPDVSVFTIDTAVQKPSIFVLTNLGLVTSTDDASRITWGFVLNATTAHPFELLAGNSHILRLNRDFASISIFAKTEFLTGGSAAADMWLDMKVWDGDP